MKNGLLLVTAAAGLAASVWMKMRRPRPVAPALPALPLADRITGPGTGSESPNAGERIAAGMAEAGRASAGETPFSSSQRSEEPASAGLGDFTRGA